MAIAAVVAAVAVFATVTTARMQDRSYLVCRILSNGMVPWLAARSAECPLHPYDRILGIESRSSVSELGRAANRFADSTSVKVRRRGTELVVDVPRVARRPSAHLLRLGSGLLIVVVVLGTAFILLQNARTRAGWPIMILYAACAVLLIVTLSTPESTTLNMAGTVG